MRENLTATIGRDRAIDKLAASRITNHQGRPALVIINPFPDSGVRGFIPGGIVSINNLGLFKIG